MYIADTFLRRDNQLVFLWWEDWALGLIYGGGREWQLTWDLGFNST